MEELLYAPINSERCGKKTWVKKPVQIKFSSSCFKSEYQNEDHISTRRMVRCQSQISIAFDF